MATITKRGNKWRVQIRKDGFGYMSKTFSTKALAETFAKDVEGRIERGVFESTAMAEETTLATVISFYKQHLLPLKGGKDVEEVRLKRIDGEWGGMSLAKITPRLIRLWKDKRLTEVSAATVLKELSLLSRLFTVAQKEMDITLPQGNPLKLVSLPSEENKPARRPTPSEEEALSTHPVVGDLVVFAIETGMRRGEISRMEWENINWNRQTLFIPKHHTKSNRARTIPLTDRAVAVLKKRQGLRPFPMLPHSITTAFRRACYTLGIKNLTFHCLRHHAVSNFFENHMNVAEVAAISGHQDLRVLMRYTHPSPEHLLSKMQ